MKMYVTRFPIKGEEYSLALSDRKIYGQITLGSTLSAMPLNQDLFPEIKPDGVSVEFELVPSNIQTKCKETTSRVTFPDINFQKDNDSLKHQLKAAIDQIYISMAGDCPIAEVWKFRVNTDHCKCKDEFFIKDCWKRHLNKTKTPCQLRNPSAKVAAAKAGGIYE